jgi:hypothetical protein
MQLLAGTSGFSYKEWLGKFYPEKHPADGMLRYYAGHFATVEINNTFYRMPAEAMLARWAEEVPENFVFTLKAPGASPTEAAARGQPSGGGIPAAGAGAGRQSLPAAALPQEGPAAARGLSGAIPDGRRVAFQFRNDSWRDENVRCCARARCSCAPHRRGQSPPVVATADSGYLRLRHALRRGARRVGGRIAPPARLIFHARGRRAGRGVRAQVDGVVETTEPKMTDATPAAGAIERLRLYYANEQRIAVLSFICGFLFDIVVDRATAAIVQQVVYIAVIWRPSRRCSSRRDKPDPGLFILKRWYYQYRTALVHFFWERCSTSHHLFLQELLAPGVFLFSRFPGFPAVGQRVRALQVPWPGL